MSEQPTDTLPRDLMKPGLPQDTFAADVPGPTPASQDAFTPAGAANVLPDSVTGAKDSVFTSELDKQAATEAAMANSQRDAQLAGTTTTTGGIPTVSGTSTGARIVRAAEAYLGTPYVWGGTSSGGVDCSGLVQLAYRAAGISLPRISFQQADSGVTVSLRALRPGDLVAWDNSPRNNGADHIAIYLGNGKIIEAAHPGTNVRIRTLGRNEGAYGVRMSW